MRRNAGIIAGVNWGHFLCGDTLAAWYMPIPRLMGSTNFYDLTGQNAPGTLTNMTTSASGWRGSGPPGGWGSLQFDGVDDYVAASSSSLLTPANAWTLAGLCRLDSKPVAAPVIIGRDSDTTGRAYQLGFANYSSTNRWNISVFNPSNVETNLVGSAGTAPAIETWYHIVATYQYVTDGASILSLYVNGLPDTSTSSAHGPTHQATGITTIGRRLYSGFPEYWPGAIASVNVWSRALSASEVASLYRESLTGYPLMLNRVPAWMMAAASGTAYTQSLTASLVVTGAMKKAISHKAAASAVTITAKEIKQVSHKIAASSSITAITKKAVSHPLRGAVTLSAALRKAVSHRLSAAVATTASIRRSLTHSLAAAVSLAASVRKSVGHSLHATLSQSGRVVKGIGKRCSTAVSTSGSIRKGLAHSLKAAVVLQATIRRGFRSTLQALVRLIGSLQTLFVPPSNVAPILLQSPLAGIIQCSSPLILTAQAQSPLSDTITLTSKLP